jgi:hypothetical protein
MSLRCAGRGSYRQVDRLTGDCPGATALRQPCPSHDTYRELTFNTRVQFSSGLSTLLSKETFLLDAPFDGLVNV